MQCFLATKINAQSRVTFYVGDVLIAANGAGEDICATAICNIARCVCLSCYCTLKVVLAPAVELAPVTVVPTCTW